MSTPETESAAASGVPAASDTSPSSDVSASPDHGETATAAVPPRSEFWAGNPIVIFTLLVMIVGLLGYTFATVMSIGPQPVGLQPGAKAPPIRVEGWINGSPPADWNDRPVLVEAFATWCVPCRPSLREVEDLRKTYGDRVHFVALTNEPVENERFVRELLEALGVEMLAGYGAEETLVHFGAETIPTTWLIDSDGIIVWTPASGGDMKSAIREQLGLGTDFVKE